MSNLVTPEQFASAAPPRRMMGAECEDQLRNPDGSLSTEGEPTLFSGENIRAAGFHSFAGRDSNDHNRHWLQNGACLYLDHPNYRSPEPGVACEYATPEALGPRAAQAALWASHVVLERLMRANPTTAGMRLLRRSGTVQFLPPTRVDKPRPVIATTGFHPNFIVPESTIKEKDINVNLLESHWATAFYTWGGMVGPDGFLLSQRASDIGSKILQGKGESVGRPGAKPFGLALLTDDVIGSDRGFGRLEGRSHEESSPWSTFMTFATTSLLLRIIEHPEMTDLHEKLSSLKLKDPVAAMKQVAADRTMRIKLELASGEELSAVELQTRLAECAIAVAERLQLPEDETWAANQWMLACRDLARTAETQDIRPLIGRMGFAAKWYYLDQTVEGPLRADNAEAIRRCLAWDSIMPKGGKRILAERKALVAVATDAEIAALVEHPPQNNRARERAKHITDPHYTVDGMGWSYAKGFRWNGSFTAGEYVSCSLPSYTTSHECRSDRMRATDPWPKAI